MDTSQIITDVVVSKWCEISPDKESDEVKQCKVILTITNVTLLDMANGLLKSEVIRWQGTNRKKFDKLVNKSTHRIVFKKPIMDVDPEEAMVDKLRNMDTDEQRMEYLDNLRVKAEKATK